MKKITTLFILIFSVQLLLSQTFGELGAEWKYSLVNKINGIQQYSTYQCDSVFVFKNRNAIRRKLIPNASFGFPCPNDVDKPYIGYNADSVFIYEDGRWQLLVDLSANNLDTTTIDVKLTYNQQSVVSHIKIQFDSVRTTVINGVTLRQVYMRNLNQTAYEFHDGWFTEKIGHEYSIIPWIFSGCSGNSKYDYGLRCYSDSLLGNINFTNYGCDTIFTSINENVLDQINAFPNPTKNIFTIDLGHRNLNFNLNVRSIEGKLIYKESNLNTEKVEIDLSQQPKGIYMVTLQDEENIKVLKLVKD